MAAVYGHISEFQDNEDWNDYIERLDQYFLANGIEDTQTVQRKRAIFLSIVGGKMYALIKTLLSPAKPADKTYNELCDLVKQHVTPKPIVIAERFKFYNRKQRVGEQITTYLTELRKLSETCSFGEFLDQALRDMFVIGLSDRNAQKKLLSEADLNIKKAYDVALGFEMANQHMDEIHGQQNDKVQQCVNKVTFNKKECFRCGKNNHHPDNCFYKDTVCHTCMKAGHIQRRCPAKKSTEAWKGKNDKKQEHKSKGKHRYSKKSSKVKYVSESSDSETDSDSKEDQPSLTLMHIRSVKSKANPEITVDVKLNGKDFTMEVDTGAAVSLMSKQAKNELLPMEKIRHSDIVLKTLTGQKVKVLGKCKVNVSYKGQGSKKLPLYIVDADGPALFGRNWLSHIKLDWHNIHKVQASNDTTLDSVLQKYANVFDESLGKINGIQATLNVKPDAKPKFFKPRPVPFALRDGIAKELARLERLGVIEKVEYSDWAAPIVPVRKPNGDIRICGDYKVTVNQDLQIPEHPMPKPEELFQSLNGGKKFTKLDLSQAYQQIELHPESRKYVTINTHLGLFTYTRLPYGISASPSIFQSAMDKMLHGLPVGCYQDDMVVTGTDDQEHLENLDNVLQRLEKANIRLQKSKCVYMAPSVTYLGFTIDSEGVRMDNDGTNAIHRAPRPTCRSELQSFLGLVNHYRKHVPNMSTTCGPLNKLLQKDAEWKWDSDTENAYTTVKRLLTTTDNILVHYDPTKQLTLAVDASPVGLGAVISHITEDGERPIAYGSRSLTSSERNYSQIEREGLAIIFGLKRFHQYLYGRKFTLITDNKPLSLILGPKKGIPVIAAARIQRWAIELASYSYDIKLRTSKQNGNADALSRLPLPDTDQPEGIINWTSEAQAINSVQVNQLPVTAKAIRRATRHDPILSKVLHLTTTGWPSTSDDVNPELQPYFNRRSELTSEEGCLLWGTRTVIPSKFQHQVLTELHSSHPGIVRMKSLARLHVWWPTLNRDIEHLVRQCNVCQDMQPKAPQAEANPWKWPSKPWTRIHIDFAGPFMGENFLIIVDAHSKWPIVFQMSSTTAERTVEKLRTVFSEHGVPIELVSDNGPQFVSEVFQDFLKVNGVHHILSPPYHPSTNGEAERFVRTFKQAMKSKKHQNASWNQKVSEFLLSYRTTPHTTTKRTPSELLLGRNLRTRLDAIRPNIGQRIQRQTSPEKQTRTVEIGEPVLARDYRQRKETWIMGIVLKKISPCTYLVQVGDLTWKRHIDQLRSADGSLLTRESSDAADVLEHETMSATPMLMPPFLQDSNINDAANINQPAIETTFHQKPVQPVTDVPNTPKSDMTAQQPRRSKRSRVSPTYLKEYCTN